MIQYGSQLQKRQTRNLEFGKSRNRTEQDDIAKVMKVLIAEFGRRDTASKMGYLRELLTSQCDEVTPLNAHLARKTSLMRECGLCG